MAKNFYPEQYAKTGQFPINHNYLHDQFADHDVILAKIAEVVRRGDFTLGAAVDRFENAFLRITGGQYAVGVGSGTDALFLSLKACGIGVGDEVITTPFTFYATIGAIVTAGASPVFVDIGSDHNIDADALEKAITPRTKAIMPVHWAGVPCDMAKINETARRYSLVVIADACHAIGAQLEGKRIAEWAGISCFSLHPLKNLNVWGDGGVIVTDDEILAGKLSLLRNHGLTERDTCSIWAYNSRLDTIQAVVAQHALDNKLEFVTESRRRNAAALDARLNSITGVRLPPRMAHKASVFHLYMIACDKRDELQAFLQVNGIDAKIHYPTPMHLQPAAAAWGHKIGDFPNAEQLAKTCLSLPVHEFIDESAIDFIAATIRKFYRL